MVVTVFRSRRKPGSDAEYAETAEQVSALASSMPGHISHKTFTAEDGERVTIAEFADHESQRNWSMNSIHMAAKQRGREVFYESYSIQVCDVVRESRFPRPA
jgi:heme-degrading monooxygenase HmoA